MPRAPSQKIQRMRQHRQNRGQRTRRPGRAARQIHDQRRSKCSAHRAAQRSQGSMPKSLSAHKLRQAINYPFADQPRGLRRHIPRSQSRPTRRHNQARTCRMTAQRCGDQIQFIGQNLRRHYMDSGSLQQLTDSWSRKVDLLPLRAAVAHRQHNGTNIGRKGWGHASQSTCFPRRFRNFHVIASAPEESSKMRK